MLITNITAVAFWKREYPSEVYAHYLDQPRDISLLMGFAEWDAQKQKAKQARTKREIGG